MKCFPSEFPNVWIKQAWEVICTKPSFPNIYTDLEMHLAVNNRFVETVKRKRFIIKAPKVSQQQLHTKDLKHLEILLELWPEIFILHTNIQLIYDLVTIGVS